MTSSSSQTSMFNIVRHNIKVRNWCRQKLWILKDSCRSCNIRSHSGQEVSGNTNTQLLWSTRELFHHDPYSLDFNVINLELFYTGFIKSYVFRNKRWIQDYPYPGRSLEPLATRIFGNVHLASRNVFFRAYRIYIWRWFECEGRAWVILWYILLFCVAKAIECVSVLACWRIGHLMRMRVKAPRGTYRQPIVY